MTSTLPAAVDRHATRADGTLPQIIQGGMGIGVSAWQLAREVSLTGELGVVSGTGLDVVLARRLQDGDPGGDLRRALAHFPVPAVADRVLDRFFRPQGRPDGTPYRPVTKLSLRPSPALVELAVVAAFAEVWLAKEGHDGLVGVNLLEKVQMATPFALYGSMLADVDYVLMGAGIPTDIPRLLDVLADHGVGRLDVHVDGATTRHAIELDPAGLGTDHLPPLRRPMFLAIVSAHVLAAYLAREDATRPDGFVVEGPIAGGHNAPPRGRLTLDETGQPVFGPRDDADLAKVAAVGLPFWVAGGYGTPEALAAARAAGAEGVQVGTLFALTDSSGLTPELRRQLLAQMDDGTLEVRTDAAASPTGFPFKVAGLPGTAADPEVYAARPRLCDLGYLRVPFEKPDGGVSYRCAAEPVADYVRKGGAIEDTVGRKCLCNALTADIGLPQTRRDGYREVPLVTLGGDLDGARRLLSRHRAGWTPTQAIAFLRGE
jgi:NAD(P)H-dependent flavin oxidoreductase YrpB (nitropropane dioxygenase family)